MNIANCVAIILFAGDKFTAHFNTFKVNAETGDTTKALTYATLTAGDAPTAIAEASKILGKRVDGCQFVQNAHTGIDGIRVVGTFNKVQEVLPPPAAKPKA
jgi:hypothetical protein